MAVTRVFFSRVIFFCSSSVWWTESGRGLGMLHKRGNCVSGNWQLPKSGGDFTDHGARREKTGATNARTKTSTRTLRTTFEFGSDILRVAKTLSCAYIYRKYRLGIRSDRHLGDGERFACADAFKGPGVFTISRCACPVSRVPMRRNISKGLFNYSFPRRYFYVL